MACGDSLAKYVRSCSCKDCLDNESSPRVPVSLCVCVSAVCVKCESCFLARKMQPVLWAIRTVTDSFAICYSCMRMQMNEFNGPAIIHAPHSRVPIKTCEKFAYFQFSSLWHISLI